MRALLFPFAGSGRWDWATAALVAASLVALGGCSKSEEAKTSSNPGAVASHAQAAQSSIASARAAHDENALVAMPMPDHALGAPADSTSTVDGTTVDLGDPEAATGKRRLLGQPLAMNAAGRLPPAPGAPQLYHLGAEGFFLEQGIAIALTPEQQGQLHAIKERADLAYAATQRKIDEAENDLWMLTSAETPEATKIDAKISEIGLLGAQQRLDFVRAVGSAVAVLDAVQRNAVIALGSARPSAALRPPVSTGTAPAAGGMPGGRGMDQDEMPMKAPISPTAPVAPMGEMPDGGSSTGMGHE